MKKQITEEEIKQISTGEKDIRDVFPEVFETKLEAGKWYKLPSFGQLLFYFNGEFGNEITYGFDFLGNFCNTIGVHKEKIKKYVLATPEEVEEALIKEAKRRDYLEKDLIIKLVDKEFLLEKEIGSFLYTGTFLFYQGAPIFCNGKWAEMVDSGNWRQQPTW